MNSEKLVKQLEVIRAITIKSIESISEELADEMPTGYKNTSVGISGLSLL